jgi:Fic family protein
MKPYLVHPLPLQNLDYQRLISLVGQANAELARYDGLLQGIVNPVILLSPITTQEAVLSSKIEGTQATLDEVLEYDAGIQMDEFKTQDIHEIGNYRKALMLASDDLRERPISLFLIREMHRILLDSVRGRDKEPGEFRRDQNWIGSKGCTIDNASFVPVSPLHLQTALADWIQYIQSDDIDALLQLAVVHAQFELIHPFKDGNGRIGRLLIPLFLYQKKKLASPMFYLSAYLEEHRDEYYERLAGISQNEDWNGWIAFFLKAIAVQASENAKKVHEILALYETMKQRIVDITHSQYSIQILDALFDHPIFQTTDLARRTNIPKQTLMPLIRQIKDSGYLKVVQEASGRRAATLAFSELLNIAEGRKIL